MGKGGADDIWLIRPELAGFAEGKAVAFGHGDKDRAVALFGECERGHVGLDQNAFVGVVDPDADVGDGDGVAEDRLTADGHAGFAVHVEVGLPVVPHLLGRQIGLGGRGQECGEGG